MSGIVIAAEKALKAWRESIAATDIDRIRLARMRLDSAENELARAFEDEKIHHSQMAFDDWVVTIEANAEMTDLGLIPAFPLIMYHRQAGRKAA